MINKNHCGSLIFQSAGGCAPAKAKNNGGFMWWYAEMIHCSEGINFDCGFALVEATDERDAHAKMAEKELPKGDACNAFYLRGGLCGPFATEKEAEINYRRRHAR